jgi:hypothetical protein
VPYVNCPDCSTRSFALAPWSTVDRCPLCDAPLAVPRQSVASDLIRREDGRPLTSLEGQTGSPG